MLGIGRGESYVIKQSGLWIQRDHTLDQESVLLADGVKGRVLIVFFFATIDSEVLEHYSSDHYITTCFEYIVTLHTL
jgi:hypothetical protein